LPELLHRLIKQPAKSKQPLYLAILTGFYRPRLLLWQSYLQVWRQVGSEP